MFDIIIVCTNLFLGGTDLSIINISFPRVHLYCSLNDDEFLPVDLSVMLGHHHIAQVLLDRGAKDSPKCK